MLDRLHRNFVLRRRVRRLATLLDDVVPRNASVLDVGCGDGSLARLLLDRRPDLLVRGLDVLVRPDTLIPVEPFDGTSLPADRHAYDVVMLVDVLHHTDDPRTLLREAARVASRAVVIKDHLMDGLLAERTLRFMDRVGNERFGVRLPYNYWTRAQWMAAWREIGLHLGSFTTTLHLYPFPAGLLFDRSLHFIARLVPGDAPLD